MIYNIACMYFVLILRISNPPNTLYLHYWYMNVYIMFVDTHICIYLYINVYLYV